MAIDTSKAIKLNNQTRRYIYPNGQVVEIKNVFELIVSDSGSHRIRAYKSDTGSEVVLHRPNMNWLDIEIDADDWTV